MSLAMWLALNGDASLVVGHCSIVTVRVVTITKVELIALEHTVKEGFALERLFRDIQLILHNRLKFYCDNMQTIRLVIENNTWLCTRLRHVDVQNMWLKQEYKNARF
jgi:hypothetical protein